MDEKCLKCLHKSVCMHYVAKRTDEYVKMGIRYDYENCCEFIPKDVLDNADCQKAKKG